MTEKKCRVCGRIIPDGHICLSCGDYDEQQRFAADKPKTNGDRIRLEQSEITHWMPLPEPPEKE